MTAREKVNAVYDRNRGTILLIAPLLTIIPALLALGAVMGFGPLNTPATRMIGTERSVLLVAARAEVVADSLRYHIAESRLEHAAAARLNRAVQIDLCSRHEGNPVLLAQMDIPCERLMPGFGRRGR